MKQSLDDKIKFVFKNASKIKSDISGFFVYTNEKYYEQHWDKHWWKYFILNFSMIFIILNFIITLGEDYNLLLAVSLLSSIFLAIEFIIFSILHYNFPKKIPYFGFNYSLGYISVNKKGYSISEKYITDKEALSDLKELTKDSIEAIADQCIAEINKNSKKSIEQNKIKENENIKEKIKEALKDKQKINYDKEKKQLIEKLLNSEAITSDELEKLTSQAEALEKTTELKVS